jgi:hypothetical protein
MGLAGVFQLLEEYVYRHHRKLLPVGDVSDRGEQRDPAVPHQRQDMIRARLNGWARSDTPW